MPDLSLQDHYDRVRQQSLAICAPLSIEDHVVQSMPDASPARWHLAHTTWFFDTFILKPNAEAHGLPRSLPDPRYEVLFNSYYKGIGDQFPRALRGTLSRPGVQQIHDWRRRVDESLMRLLETDSPEIHRLALIGLNHEQQHQELMVTDIKHALMSNPLWPVYREDAARLPAKRPEAASGAGFEGGKVTLGFEPPGFCFDNETPRHDVWLAPFALSGELVTHGQWLEFMEDGGYSRHDLWLSDGWDVVQQRGWHAPLYWARQGDQWLELTLGGPRPLPLNAPVTHISFFEADAYARWAGARLPTEFEWEHAAEKVNAQAEGNFLEAGVFHPVGCPTPASGGLRHLLGELWEWTSSPYRPHRGYKPLPGALGEYNGKFMNGQYVLRGGSCATPRDHIRRTYRNFFGPDKRWQFTGLRLARDL